jgi:RND family efflux transporter MFP subunit
MTHRQANPIKGTVRTYHPQTNSPRSNTNLADLKLDYPDEYDKREKYFNSLSYKIQIKELPKFNSTKEKNFIISRRIMTEFLSIKSYEERLKKYKFYAPFDGSITKSYIDISTNVNIGTPIIDIIRDGKKEVELNINNKDRKLISVGNLVTLTDDKKSEYNGFVSRIGNFVNPETQNISVFVEIPKKSIDRDLFNGMYLNAQIETYTKMIVCIIPRRSLISNNEIFNLNENNSLEVKSINIITEQDNNIIVDNIKDGERVIIEPLVNVKTGTKVIPIEL